MNKGVEDILNTCIGLLCNHTNYSYYVVAGWNDVFPE